MHYRLEIIMPQVEDIEEAVNQILKPYSEDNEDGYPGFYDWYVIGGRWAGQKLIDGLDQDKLDAFYDELKEKKITVSGIQCGKQKLEPESQIPEVDKLWSDYFPEYKGRACPLFQHSNNQYANDCLYGDVLRVKDVHPETSCSTCIIASLNWEENALEAKVMLMKNIWNGVTYQDTTFDGKVLSAIEFYKDKTKNYKPGYKEKRELKDDWLVVTVDYHS